MLLKQESLGCIPPLGNEFLMGCAIQQKDNVEDSCSPLWFIQFEGDSLQLFLQTSMQAPCLYLQVPSQEGQPGYALSHSIPQITMNLFIPTKTCKGLVQPGKMGEIPFTYRLSNSRFGSEALLLTGRWILASFAPESAALAWIIHSPAVLSPLHIPHRRFAFHSSPQHCLAVKKGGCWFGVQITRS